MKILLHLKTVKMLVVATSQEEANEILARKSETILNLPDLLVYPENIRFSNSTPMENQEIEILASVTNLGTAGSKNVQVDFTVDDETVQTLVIPSIAAYETQNITIRWNASFGVHSIQFKLNRNSLIQETNYANNQASRSIFVASTSLNDVAVKNAFVSRGKTVMGQGYDATLNIMVQNEGLLAAAFNVTAYANATIVGETQVTLESLESVVLSMTWNTSGFPKGNYTISAIADTVPGETDTEDNTFVDGGVFVTIPGDVNGDKRVNVLDCILVANHFGHVNGDGHTPGSKEWLDCANCDINSDSKTNVLDCIILSNHFGQSWT
jgi:subtilase family serine protease